MMEWSTDTKSGYDDLEVYMEYGYVFVSTTGRNHVKMAAFSFNVNECFKQELYAMFFVMILPLLYVRLLFGKYIIVNFRRIHGRRIVRNMTVFLRA